MTKPPLSFHGTGTYVMEQRGADTAMSPVMGENFIPGALSAVTPLHDSSRGAALPEYLVAALALVLGGGVVTRESADRCLDADGHRYNTGYNQPALVSNDVH